MQVEEAEASPSTKQDQPAKERGTAAERAFAAAEEKVVTLTRQLAAAKMQSGDQPSDISDLKRQVANLQAEVNDKVSIPCCSRPDCSQACTTRLREILQRMLGFW